MTTDNKYVCKKCGEEQTGNKASELDHRGCEAEDDGPLAGFHKWVPEEYVCDVEPVEDVEDVDNSDEPKQWKGEGGSCPHCNAPSSKQMVTARPSQNTPVEMSLPTRVLECSTCGGEWEQ